MSTTVKACSLDRRPWPVRVASAVGRSLSGYLSRQAAHPRGMPGRALGRLWVAETSGVNDAAIELLDLTGPEEVLEIGFGPGRTLGLLADRALRVTGVEVSTSMIDLAARRNARLLDEGRIALQLGDGRTLPLAEDSVDVVLSVHNLYFWPDPQLTLREIARVLRPGGRALLVFRGGEHPLPGRLDPAVYRSVETDEAVAWLADAGFTGVRSHRPAGVPTTLAFVEAAVD